MIETLWNWAIERTREILNALNWAIHKAGDILISLINEIGKWIDTQY